jgi:DNA-binding CsgD family transcriptional regulator
MAKKRKPEEKPVELGRWKKDQKRRLIFIQRALSMTLAPNPKIADRAGVERLSVASSDRRWEIRPLELRKAIKSRHASAIQTGRILQEKRKKVGYYKTAGKKWAVVREHSSVIESIASQWWKSNLVKNAFDGKWEDFLNTVKRFVFKQLDYFDPKRKTEDGKPAKIKRWIGDGVKIICRRIYIDGKKASGKNKSLLLELARGKVGPVVATSRVPKTARPLLEKLGLKIKTVAELGFGDIRKQILKIANEKETGLMEREKRVVEMRFGDKELAEIGRELGIGKTTVFNCETSAARKIRARLERL